VNEIVLLTDKSLTMIMKHSTLNLRYKHIFRNKKVCLWLKIFLN